MYEIVKKISMENQEAIITLKEITDIIEVHHGKAFEKIRKLSEQPSFGAINIVSVSTGGRPTKTFQLNRKQAIAVGAKLNDELFMKVIDRVEEIENKADKMLMTPNQITNALALTAKSLQLQDERMDSQHERIQEVELYIQEDLKSRPVSFVQQKALQDVKNAKVYQLAPTDEKLQKKLHMKVWSVFKKNFHLPRYNELPAIKFDEAIWFINNLEMNDML